MGRWFDTIRERHSSPLHNMHTEIIALVRELWPDIRLVLLVTVFSWGISRCFLAIAMGKRMAR